MLSGLVFFKVSSFKAMWQSKCIGRKIRFQTLALRMKKADLHDESEIACG